MDNTHPQEMTTEFPNTPPEVLEEIAAAVHPLPGWTSVARCQEMADAIFETKPKLAVELGVFGGRTLIAQAIAMRASGHGGIVVGIDPWSVHDAIEDENEENIRFWGNEATLEAAHKTTMHAIWSRALQGVCVVIRSASQFAAPLFGEIDHLYIDGNHAEVPCLRDIELWVPKVKAGAYVFVDDVDWISTSKGYARLKEMADVVAIGDEVLPDGTHRKGHYWVCRKK